MADVRLEEAKLVRRHGSTELVEPYLREEDLVGDRLLKLRTLMNRDIDRKQAARKHVPEFMPRVLNQSILRRRVTAARQPIHELFDTLEQSTAMLRDINARDSRIFESPPNYVANCRALCTGSRKSSECSRAFVRTSD